MYPITLSQILQRLPIITHGFVLVLVSVGPWLCPIFLAACFFLTNVAFVSSQVRMAYSMIRCYWGVRAHWKTDWWSIYLQGIQSAPIEALDIRHSPHTLPHLIIIPSYKESLSTLRQTLAILASHPLAPHSYNVCLGMEQREEGSLQKGQLLAEEFEGQFSDIVVTVHPADIKGEVPGKGSNTRWAARWMAEREATRSLRGTQSGVPTPDVDAVLTVMDADTAFAADYFLAVAVRYLLTSPEKRKVMMFVPPLIFDRNQSDVPAFTRVTDIMWSTAGISGIYPSSTIKIPTSAYSMSLGLATHVGFWDAGPGAIGEDMHMFCKALFDTHGHLHVETIYSPASQCNVVGSNSHQGNGYIANFFGDCHARWTQAVRHMWGSLDTGYVAHRLLTGDFGVSYDREVEHHSQRLEMRRNVLDAAAKIRSTVQERLPVAESQHSARTSRKIVIPPTWIANSGLTESPTPSSDEETVSSESSSSRREGILRSQRPPLTRASSSHYSYSSMDEECVPEVDSGSELTAFMTFQSRGDPSGVVPTSTSFSFSRLQKVKKYSFLVLAMRMYEAHIMLAHLFIFLNAFIVFPKLFSYLEKELARQTEAWGRSSFGPSNLYTTTDDNGGRSIIFALMGGLWMEQDAIVSKTVSICNRLGAIGAASTLVTFLFHDLYHREAGKRWKGNNTPVTNLGMMELGHRHSSLVQPANLSLGIPPHPQVTRRMPWCFFDYLAVPGGLAFGVAPLLYAQMCHIWTDRLAYRVSAKPQQGR